LSQQKSEEEMVDVTVSSDDLRAALSLLEVYMGFRDSAGVFKDPGKQLPDAYFFVRIANLQRALDAAKDNLESRA
jgi:hypothetical protein